MAAMHNFNIENFGGQQRETFPWPKLKYVFAIFCLVILCPAIKNIKIFWKSECNIYYFEDKMHSAFCFNFLWSPAKPEKNGRYYCCYIWCSSKIWSSRGDICVANFIPPAYGVSQGQGNYFWPKMQIQPKTPKFKKSFVKRQILWHHIWVYVDFFFLLNLLPSYSLRSQGDKICNKNNRMSFLAGAFAWTIGMAFNTLITSTG